MTIPFVVYIVRLLFLFMAGYCLYGIQAAHAGNDQWMKDLSIETPSALDRKLSEFIFPGTHDSGTYSLQPKAAWRKVVGRSVWQSFPSLRKKG